MSMRWNYTCGCVRASSRCERIHGHVRRARACERCSRGHAANMRCDMPLSSDHCGLCKCSLETTERKHADRTPS